MIERCNCSSKEICACRTDICASNAVKEACAIFKTAAAVAVEDVGAMFSVVLERKREKRERVFKCMIVTMLSRPTNSLRERLTNDS